MTNPSHTEKDVAEIARNLTQAQRDALMANSVADRRGLVGLKLVHWKQRPGQRVKSLMPTSLGYAVRNHLISTPDMPKGEG